MLDQRVKGEGYSVKMSDHQIIDPFFEIGVVKSLKVKLKAILQQFVVRLWSKTAQIDWRAVGRPSSCNAFKVACCHAF